MNFSTVATICRAVGAAFTAAADSLAHSSAPGSVSAPDPARNTPAPNPALDSADKLIAQALRSVLSEAASTALPAVPTQRRRNRIPRRYKPDGTLGPDFTTDGVDYVVQRAVCERLGLHHAHVIKLENAGRLERFHINGKVAYRLADVEALAAKVEAAQAQDVTEV